MIDWHCHIDLYPEPAKIVDRCVAEAICVLSVTTTPSAWRGTRVLEKGNIETALGLHPQLAHRRKSELALFDKYLPEARYVGEVGLDGSAEFHSAWRDQVEVFEHILTACVNAGGRVLSVHSRRATRKVLDSLAEHNGCGTPVLHWFSGSVPELGRAAEMGCWFSVGPAMLRSKRGRALAAHMPIDRVVTESDGPFAQVDGRPACPWDMPQAVEVLAEMWCTDARVATEKIEKNWEAMVGLRRPNNRRRAKGRIRPGSEQP